LGVKEAVISASLRHTEIETPIDLFGAIDEPSPEPEFEVTFANSDPSISAFGDQEELLEETLEEEQLQEDEVEVEEIEEEELLEETLEEEQLQENEVEEEELEEENGEVTNEEEPLVENLFEEVEEDQTSEAVVSEPETPSSWEPEFSGDQPIWMAEMEANIRDNRSVFPLESLIGAFTLNEKLQFINELFDGSSDDFSSNVKQLDQLASIDAARNMIAELADTFSWDTESEIVEDFIYKICRRYATGA
jgi:hypothetical protein